MNDSINNDSTPSETVAIAQALASQNPANRRVSVPITDLKYECYAGTNVPQVSTHYVDLQDVSIELSEPKPNKRRVVTGMTIAGEKVTYSDRFGDSLAGLLGQSRSIYQLFEPTEVISRAIERGIKAPIRVATVASSRGHEALAVTRPGSAILPAEEYVNLLRDMGVDMAKIGYSKGTVVSHHDPTLGGGFSIQGDAFSNKFALDCPIDGYGTPSAYLMMLRQICSNGMIAMASAFRTSIQLGKSKDENVSIDPMPTMTRFIESFNNEEGFVAIRNRMESATQSWASLDEYHGLMSRINRDCIAGKDGRDSMVQTQQIRAKLNEQAGTPEHRYGLISLEQISAKLRRSRPVGMTVYDLVNFATEVGTHHATESGRRAINGFVGGLLADAGLFDLEHSRMNNESPQDLFLPTAEELANDEFAQGVLLAGGSLS